MNSRDGNCVWVWVCEKKKNLLTSPWVSHSSKKRSESECLSFHLVFLLHLQREELTEWNTSEFVCMLWSPYFPPSSIKSTTIIQPLIQVLLHYLKVGFFLSLTLSWIIYFWFILIEYLLLMMILDNPWLPPRLGRGYAHRLGRVLFVFIPWMRVIFDVNLVT